MNQDSNKIDASLGAGGLEMFANRLKKNKKEIAKWAKKNSITCYRLYDKDVPQVPVAIDNYDGDYVLQYFRGPYDQPALADKSIKTGVVLNKYAKSKPVDNFELIDNSDKVMDDRIRSIEEIIIEVLQIQPNRLFTKLREKKKGNSQYNKLSKSYQTKIVHEHSAKFKINLSDYLDVGLFLDHRPLREKVSLLSEGKSVLNLFSYTGAFTIHSGIAGAKFTTSVDSSPVYLDWTQENLKINNLDNGNHQLVCSDIFDWLEDYSKKPKSILYDIIILDPPTFSNNKKKEKVFDLQVNHDSLIKDLMENFLNKKGFLFFSTNFRKFKLADEISKLYHCLDISDQTVPYDFRDKKIHKSWQIEFKDKAE